MYYGGILVTFLPIEVFSGNTLYNKLIMRSLSTLTINDLLVVGCLVWGYASNRGHLLVYMLVDV